VIKRSLDEGALGKPVSATGTFALPGQFEPYNWRCGRDTNRGGALMQLGIHHIETFTYLFGPVVEVRGVFANAAAPYDVDDIGAAFLTHQNRVTSCVTSSYVSPLAYGIHVYGTEANLDCVLDMQYWPDIPTLDRTAALTIQKRGGRHDVPVTPQDSLALQLEEFARCIADGDEPETGADVGLAAVATVEAALLSFANNGPVDPRSLL
jgi:predicted dehydrogenase